MDGLTKLKNGRWRARITWRDAMGRRHDTDRVIKADSKGQAMAERERIREELAGTGDEWTVAEAIAEWLPTMRTGTRLAREVHSRRFSELFGKLKLSNVRTADVQRWIAGLECSDDTANNYRASILALYKFARARGRLRGEDPIARTIRRLTPRTNAQWLEELEGPTERRALVGDELPRFFAALLEREPELYPLARCQLLLGCRWSEASALQWRDVDWKTGIVTIRRSQSRNGEIGPPKGKRARTTALGPEGLAFLRGHRASMEREGWPGSDTWCFPRPMTGRPRRYDLWPYPTAASRVRGVLEALGIDLACSTHAMRHSHVTLARALESDAVLRETVGHTTGSLTERYTDESHRRAKAAGMATELEARIGGALGGADVVPLTCGAKNVGRRKNRLEK